MRRTRYSSFFTLIGVTLLALAVRVFVMESYRIPTPMMKPTLEPGDVVFALKPPFVVRIPGLVKPLIEGRFPKYSEVVVFSSPSTSTGIESIRRVLALPGDTVAIEKGRPVLNGVLLPLDMDAEGGCGAETHPSGHEYRVCFTPPLMEDQLQQTVPPGFVFVLADSRQHVPESQATAGINRNWALIPLDNLRAKALRIWISVDPDHSRIRTHRFFKKIL